MSTNENLSPAIINKLLQELKNLTDKPAEGIRVIINEDNIADIVAEISGPVDTPYEGGLFRVKLVLPQDYPQNPPKGYFLTKIFHPNISKSGEICVNTLKRDWQPTHDLRHIFMVIRCLLIEPFPESALNEEAAKQLLEDYEGYAKYAKLMTNVHAQLSRLDSGASSEGVASDTSGTPKKKLLRKKSSLKRL